MQNQDKFQNTPVQFLKGIGEKRAQALAAVGVFSLIDLIQYFPRRYLDRSHITSIKNLKLNEQATAVGKVQTCGIKKGVRPRFILVLTDETGYLTCIWFHQLPYWQKRFKPGQLLAVSGKISYFGGKQIIHPDFDLLSEESENLEDDFLHTGAIIPIYPSTEALSRVGLDSRGFRRILKNLVKNYAHQFEESLPSSIICKNNLLSFATALRNIHFPESFQLLQQAQMRLKFEELFWLEFMLAFRKQKIQLKQSGIRFSEIGDRTKELAEKLPFQLTDAQRKVLKEIHHDLRSPHPMYRLLQGDVGSGKTIVALVTMLIAIENGYQAALMAPTEILAEQHYLTFKKMLTGLKVNIHLLIGSQKKSERDLITSEIVNGVCHIVIGTHAIIQEKINFYKLGLVVIDEQHRFGVSQRAELFQKGNNPDVLVMTATPIPRTLSLTVYGDLDISVIDEMPSGRKPIKTTWRFANKRLEIYQFVKSKIEQGQQAYIVFPLIEESEKLDLKAATESYNKLRQGIFANYKIALLHGRLKSEEKEAIMESFKKNQTQILISTTVIEVGVDIPNATIMVIENAERFGLTQLHQLRGRVGRGSNQSYCILIAQQPLTEEAQLRLNTMTKTTNGFEIAEVDLQLRGPGEFFGTKQHGLPELKIANPITDTPLLKQARDEAFRIIHEDQEMEELMRFVKSNSFFQNYVDKIELLQIG